ncbi:MAG: hypothetical protein KKF46_05660 [Nanoarchaeota archaeon]|nr:hypothetical protein [Nanoarchaeota archaeon]MBU1321818.1 hypothetical protein [Nanoarchaeota archaeon]MBU1596988.1 hypothetical protein [Nanoarchaeota archaeon]MBU2442169.1 hypothetical protein [Nanoarchaeota archaeon]
MMNIKNKLLQLSLFIIIFIISSTLVFSLGISPAKKILNFEPGSSVEFQVNILNSEYNSFQANIGAGGDIANLIFFEEPIVDVKSEVYEVPFNVIVKFPAQLEPGVHTGFIKITPVLTEPGDSMFSAYISPKMPLNIRVPYPAKYLSLGFRVLDVDEGTPVVSYVTFDNLGSEDITQTWAEVDIYDSENKFLQKLTTRKISIESNSDIEIQTQQTILLPRGSYRAVVTAYYDGLEKKYETQFNIGESLVRIRELITRQLKANEINKIVFKAYNEWNTELGVSGFIEIDGRQNEMPVFSILADEEKEATGFFDTTGMKPGEYEMSITLMYNDQIRTESFVVIISEKLTEEPGKPSKIPVFIWILIIAAAVILALVIWQVQRRKTSRERNRPESISFIKPASR